MIAAATACRHYRTGEVLVLEPDGPAWSLRAPRAGETAETDLYLSPALVDLQINGYGGLNFTSPTVTVDDIAAVTRQMRAAGIPYFSPTIVTASRETMHHALRTYERACAECPEVAAATVGYHLEGPYISSEDGPRGAHPVEYTRDPDWDEFRVFQEAAGGHITYVTLAPERDGAMPFIEKLAEAGILAAIGHAGPTTAQVADAAAAGARLCTHLGNGAHAMLPRHPNYLWDMLAEDRLNISLIADGFHLPPQVVKVMVRAKSPARTVLVSDIFTYSGMPVGIYRLDDNRQAEVAPSGRIGLYNTPFLVGANALVDECVSNAVAFAGVSLPDALDMASVNAWRLLNRPEPTLAPGVPVEAAMLFRWTDGRLQVDEVL